jgi:hypothetical protein
MLLKENLKSFEPLNQTLGIVEAIDPNDEHPRAETGYQVPYQRGPHISARERLKRPGFDADGVSGEIPPRKLGEVEPEMQDRPQHPVGEIV